MHDRPEPDGVEPTPYLPAWLDGTPWHGREYGQAYGPEHERDLGPDHAAPAYGQPPYTGPTYGGPTYGGPEYGGSDHGSHYGAQYEAHYGSPQYGAGDFDEQPTPYQQLDRYEAYDYGAHGIQGDGDQYGQAAFYGGGGGAPEYRPRPGEPAGRRPADPPSGQQFYPRRSAGDEQPSAAVVPRRAEPVLVPTRRERRDARGGARLGRPVRILLVVAVVACLGVFGYWGWTFYAGEPAGVREGSCIAALDGNNVKPLDCASSDAKYTVLEVFKGASDATTCTVVLGATNPMVVHRDGRTDVWCVAPNAPGGNG